VERLLVDAQFAPTAEERFRRYAEAVKLAPGDAYAALLYGDELFHRGPLAGRPLAEAEAMLLRAVTIDPSLAPAWEHLAWARIRLGRRSEARLALDSLQRTAGRPDESRIYLPALLAKAYSLRFEASAPARGEPPFSSLTDLALAARGALAFDMPEAELSLGAALAAAAEPRSPLRPSALVAQGVAQMALGRPVAAFARFDSAAALFVPREEAELQAAEWRVIPAALGQPGVPSAEATEGRRRLATIAAGMPDARAARAVWVLGLDDLVRGDTVGGRAARDRLRALGAAEGPLDVVLAGLEEQSRGRPSAALAMTASALAYDSSGRAPDPFLRATLHLLRGDWLASDGQPDQADRSWLWYENTDVVDWPSAEAQPAEVDWSLGPHAGVRRAELAFRRGDRSGGCALASRTLAFWSSPEPAVEPAADSLRRLVQGCS
jgi:tetratricopeptide (TPR) repeat protein